MILKSPANFFLPVTCFIFLSYLLTGCSPTNKFTADFLYFQNGANIIVAQQKETLIQPNDLLGVQVYSRTSNQDQATIFNIPVSASGAVPAGYQVDAAGNLELPRLGPVRAAGLTRSQLQNLLEQKLTSNEFVKNPSVLVRFLQFNVNVIGEVKSPGTKTFAVDKVTVIDALSSAGDLTDLARRDDITIIREEGGKKIFHTIDLRDKSVFQSPVFILQPNDIVYVRPSSNKLKTLSVDPEAQRKTNTILSFTSIGFGIIALLLSIIR